MKAERRHELKHNELADWLAERLDTARPHLLGVALGIGILLLLVLGSAWYFGGEKAASATAWSQYFSAFDDREPQKSLSNVAAAHSGSKAAWWALLSLGDLNLGDGAALLYSDRAEAKRLLDKAAEAFKQVEAADEPILRARARLGLAKVYESLCQPDDARKYYEMVAESDKDSAIGKAAAADAKRMKDAREVAFLDWFVKQTPKKPAPLPGVGGGVPGLPSSLPDRPDISPPTGIGLGDIGSANPAAPAPAFPPPASEVPAVPPATPTEGGTSAESKSTEKKSGEESSAAKPNNAAPATDKTPAADAGEKKSD